MAWCQLAKLMRLVRNRLPEFISDVLGHTVIYRTFPSLCLPPIQSECKCEVYVMVISCTLHTIEN